MPHNEVQHEAGCGSNARHFGQMGVVFHDILCWLCQDIQEREGEWEGERRERDTERERETERARERERERERESASASP